MSSTLRTTGGELGASAGRALYLSAVWLTVGFTLAPLAFTVWVAFFDNRILSFPPDGYTAAWFAQAWRDGSFRDGFVLSVEVAAVASLVAVLVGTPAALAIARRRFPGRELVHAVLMSPVMIPAIVLGTAIYLFYVEVEIRTGLQLVPTLPGLVLAHVLIAIPWVMRLLVASLAGLDPATEEASLSLGADRFTTFRRITLPLIWPGMTAGALFGFIASFGDLEKSLLLVGPGRTTLPIAMLNYLAYRTDPTIMAVATIQIVVVGLALVVTDRFVRLGRTF